MSTPLVDPEGFPRSDIDVAGVRTARHQINCLRNDLKDIMNQMSKLLEEGLPRLESGLVTHEEEAQRVALEDKTSEGWARINSVAEASPAQLAVSHSMSLHVNLQPTDIDNLMLAGSRQGRSHHLIRRRQLSKPR